MCGYGVLLLLLMGLLRRIRRRRPRLGHKLLLTGIFCHEASHWLMGKLARARPMRFDLEPRQVGPGRWLFGSVHLSRLTPWNRIPVGLSALLLLPLAWHLVLWRSRLGWPGSWIWEWAWAHIVASLLLCAWPSKEDLALAFTDSRWLMVPLWGGLLAVLF